MSFIFCVSARQSCSASNAIKILLPICGYISARPLSLVSDIIGLTSTVAVYVLRDVE